MSLTLDSKTGSFTRGQVTQVDIKGPGMFKSRWSVTMPFSLLIIITCLLNEDSCYPKPVFGFSRMFVRSRGLSSI